MKESIEIPVELREALGKYIEELRIKNNLGFNQLSFKIGMNVRTLNEIINGKMKRIIPYHLKKIAYGLKIDYKDLYKMVDYLEQEDFLELENYKNKYAELEKKYEDLEKKYEDLEKKLKKDNNKVKDIINHGNQVIGFNSTVKFEDNSNKDFNYNISELSFEKLEELKKFIKYLKMSE